MKDHIERLKAQIAQHLTTRDQAKAQAEGLDLAINELRSKQETAKEVFYRQDSAYSVLNLELEMLEAAIEETPVT